MFLTAQQVEYLTEYVRPADQRRWLRQNGIPFLVGAKGRPKVLASDLTSEKTNQRVSVEPDWHALPRKVEAVR